MFPKYITPTQIISLLINSKSTNKIPYPRGENNTKMHTPKDRNLEAQFGFFPTTMYIVNNTFYITNVCIEKYLSWQSRYTSFLETSLMEVERNQKRHWISSQMVEVFTKLKDLKKYKFSILLYILIEFTNSNLQENSDSSWQMTPKLHIVKWQTHSHSCCARFGISSRIEPHRFCTWYVDVVCTVKSPQRCMPWTPDLGNKQGFKQRRIQVADRIKFA